MVWKKCLQICRGKCTLATPAEYSTLRTPLSKGCIQWASQRAWPDPPSEQTLTLCPFGRSLWIRIPSSCFLAVGPGERHCLWEPRFSSSANWGAHTFLAGFCEDEVGPCGMPDVLRKREYVCLLLALPGRMSPCFSLSPTRPQQGII